MKLAPLCAQYEASVASHWRHTATTTVKLAEATGVNPRALRVAIIEMLVRGVLRLDEYGFYNKRMVVDEEKRIQAQKYGRMGGNPMIVERVNPSLNPREATRVNSREAMGVKPEVEVEVEEEEEGDIPYGIRKPYVPIATAAEEPPTPPPPPKSRETESSRSDVGGLVGENGKPGTEDIEPVPPSIIECVQREWGVSGWSPGTEIWVRGWRSKGASESQILFAVMEAARRGVRSRAYAGKIVERLMREGEEGPVVPIYAEEGEAIVEWWDADTWAARCGELDAEWHKRTGQWRLRPAARAAKNKKCHPPMLSSDVEDSGGMEAARPMRDQEVE